MTRQEVYLERSAFTVANDDLFETIDALSPLKETRLGGHGDYCNQQSAEDDQIPDISLIPHHESSSLLLFSHEDVNLFLKKFLSRSIP